jgi:putative SOS response-associated peptidase YedK
MCGRYVSPDTASIEREWHIGRTNSNPFPQRWNVLPTSQIPILRHSPHFRELELTEARWGYIPGWWRKPKPPGSCFNARSEEAASKPTWKRAWRQWRCLIPAVGWYEWEAAERTIPATGEIQVYKQPHFIYRADRRLVCFGGLLSFRPLIEGAGVLSCAIVTRDAVPSVRDVHDRMPVIVQEAHFAKWLDPNVGSLPEVQEMVDLAQAEFVHHPVTTRLSAAKTDEAEFANPA